MTDAQSRYVEVNGHKLHYLTQGKGKTVIFIHGIPTSSYLWRNIMPSVAEYNECFAIDLIGMGESDKPDIQYTIDEHIDYFSGFIEKLGLKNIHLIMHGWGSLIGLCYAQRHSKNVASVAVVEGYLNLPESSSELPLPVQHMAILTKDYETLKRLVLEENYLIEKMLPSLMLNKLSEVEHNAYRQPFIDKNHRQVLLQAILDIPFINEQSPTNKMVGAYCEWLKECQQPKLLMYGVPGFLTSMSTIEWAIDYLQNLTVVEIGEGLHYLPETRSEEIAQTLCGWL